MIFISGIHGVGKSFFCNQVKRLTGIAAYTASELISSEKNELFSANKQIKDIDDNQYYLLRAVKRLNSIDEKFILDGHFCLLNSSGQITRIPIDTFIKLAPSAIILLTEKPEVIAERRKTRDNICCNIDEIAQFQKEEISYSKEIAKLLSVELKISHGADDLNSVVEFMRNI
ncbi:MAG: AAA family ATPase [Ruminococcus sp.]|nr:AAA family ATPase [Ruminococcus sp.]